MRHLSLFALMVFSLNASAQISYRDNDPFVFCRYGQKDKNRCWWPTTPYTGRGAYMVNPLCRPYNYYGKQWSSDDWQSFFQYEAICPIAKESGKWEGQGDGTKVPSDH